MTGCSRSGADTELRRRSSANASEAGRDGAIAEAVDQLTGGTRADFLRNKAVIGGSALAAALEAPALAQERNTPKDIAILSFDLNLEYRQAATNSEAERLGEASTRTLEWSRSLGANEGGHVKAILGLLGREAVKSPSFNFRGVTEDDRAFTETAVAFEDLTAALLKTQAVQVDSRLVLAALVSLHTVEARHAAVRTRLVIDRARLTATPARDERPVLRIRVAIGTPSTGTRKGRLLRPQATAWVQEPSCGPVTSGPRARSTRASEWPAGGFVGIHGTNRPLITGCAYHG